MSNTKIILALLGLGLAGYLIYSYYKEQPPSPPDEASYSTHFNKWVEIK